MKKNVKISEFLIMIFVLLGVQTGFAQQGHEIKVKVEGLKDTVLILGYHMDGKTLASDTAQVNKRGEAVFKGQEPLYAGMYFIFLPSKNIFNILIGKDQHFSVKTTNDKPSENLKFSGSTINEAFYEYEQYLKKQSGKMKNLNDEYKAAKDDDAKKAVQKKMQSLNDEVKSEQDRLITTHKGTFLSKFLKATQPVDVPDAPASIEEDKKREWQYLYYKQHFFDNFDLSDSALVRTALLKPKLTEFLEKVLLQVPDSIINDLDALIKRTEGNREVFKYVLATSYNHYNKSNIMGMDEVWLYLADYYLRGDAYWGNEEQIKKIKERADKIRPNLIGNTAFNFTCLTIDKKWMKLDQIKADHTILFFFEPDCSHCNKEAPKMREVYKRLRKRGVAVIGFFTQADTTEWYKFNEKHNVNWLHVWSPHSNEYRNNYNIYSTPTIYLLDKDKKILAKRIDGEQMEKIILERQLHDFSKQIIESDLSKEDKEKEKLKLYERYLGTCNDTTETRIVAEVMKQQRISEDGQKKIDEFKGNIDKLILMDGKLKEAIGTSTGKELKEKLEAFLNNYKTKQDLFIIKQLLLKDIKDEKEAKSLSKLMDKRIGAAG